MLYYQHTLQKWQWFRCKTQQHHHQWLLHARIGMYCNAIHAKVCTIIIGKIKVHYTWIFVHYEQSEQAACCNVNLGLARSYFLALCEGQCWIPKSFLRTEVLLTTLVSVRFLKCKALLTHVHPHEFVYVFVSESSLSRHSCKKNWLLWGTYWRTIPRLKGHISGYYLHMQLNNTKICYLWKEYLAVRIVLKPILEEPWLKLYYLITVDQKLFWGSEAERQR